MMYDVIIVGAGQAGLSLAYYLRNKKISYVVLDQGKNVGDSWKSRYDSLKLLTPRSHSTLPGLKMDGYQDGYPSKNEAAKYFKKYALLFKIPIILNTKVLKLEKSLESFTIYAEKIKYKSRAVVIATGSHRLAKYPDINNFDSKNIFNIHSSEFKNSTQVPLGATLVVGSGNSGVQIALELAESRTTILSCAHPIKCVPKRILGRSIDFWLSKLGLLKVIYGSGKYTILGKYLMSSRTPIIVDDLNNKFKKKNVLLKKRLVKITKTNAVFEDGDSVEIKNIIWATGFKDDFSWIKVPTAFLTGGGVDHVRGESAEKGLFFLGLPWQHSKE